MVSLVMLLIALFRVKGTGSLVAERKTWRLLIALITYDVILVVFDPFVEAADEASCLIGISLVLLPLFCLKPFVRRRAWLAISGVVLFQATAAASLFYNFPAKWGGVGYLYWWVM